MTAINDGVAFITGGGGSIGFGLALACLEGGMKVALADVNEERLLATQKLLGKGSDQVTTVKLDVTSPESWEDAAKAVEARLGPVRMLFNNAGVTSVGAVAAGGGLVNLSLDEWRWTLAVNLDGVFLGLKTFVPRFLAAGERCHIINTSSMAAVAAMQMDAMVPVSYSASKAGVVHMSAQLRSEFRGQGVDHIGVSILYPGLTKSDIFANSLNLSPDGAGVESSASINIGADPVLVGRHAWRAIARGDFHIFPAQDYRENILAYLAEIRHSFVENADPSYRDISADKIDMSWARDWPDQKI